METDQIIARLGERLDEWCQANLATLAAMDKAAQVQALLRGAAIVKEIDRLKAEALTALRLLINQQASMPSEERVGTLVRGFVLAAKLRGAVNDELGDIPAQHEIVRLMDAIAGTLDGVGSGRRTALAPLLEDEDARVRASAGAYLVMHMPEQVLPVLRQVEKDELANSAHFMAVWAIARWESEGQ